MSQIRELNQIKNIIAKVKKTKKQLFKKYDLVPQSSLHMTQGMMQKVATQKGAVRKAECFKSLSKNRAATPRHKRRICFQVAAKSEDGALNIV